jgi:hypothetical protein
MNIDASGGGFRQNTHVERRLWKKGRSTGGRLRLTGLGILTQLAQADPAKYWESDKPTDLVFRNGMGCHVCRRFISAIAEQ